MAILGAGQQTLTDMNDVVSSPGNNPPVTFNEGTLWFNTTDNLLYIRTGNKWLLASEGLQIGARNILLNTGFKNGTTSWGFNLAPTTSVITETLALSGKALRMTLTATANQGMYQLPPIGKYPVEEDGKEFTISFYAKSSVAGKTMYSTLEGARATANRLDITLTTSYVKYTHVVKGSGTRNAFVLYSNNTTACDVTVHSYMVTEGNVEIDWIPAVEDNDTIIDNINITLGNMANDNIIDYNERQVVKDRLAEIIGFIIADSTTALPTTATMDAGANKGSFYYIRKDAQMAGLSTTDAKYVAVATQYDNLRTYLEALTPIDAWDLRTATQSTNITVVKDTFRDKWMKYYQAELDLANAVAEQLKKNVDDIGVGGTNYASNGSFEMDFTKSLWNVQYVGQTRQVIDISTETPPFKYAYYVKNTTNANAGIFSPVIWTGKVAEAMVDKEITISFWAKYSGIVQGTNSWNFGRFGEIIVEGETAGAAKVYRYPRASNVNATAGNQTSSESYYFTGTDTTWKKYTVTHKLSLPATAVKLTNIQFKHGLEGCVGEFWTTGIKIEVGNKATDWSQSPLDINDRFTNVEFKITPDQIFAGISSSDIYNATLNADTGDWGFEQGQSLWYQDHALATKLAGGTSVTGVTGASGKVLQITGEKWIFYGRKIPVDTSRSYKVTFKVKQTVDGGVANTSKVYAGVGAYDVNKSPLITGTFGSHRYVAIDSKNITVADNWVEYSGIIKGEGNDGYSQFIPGTKYVTPMCIVNYQGGTGTVQIDTVKFEDITDLDAVATRIGTVELLLDKDGLSLEIEKTSFYKNLYGGEDAEGNPIEGDLSSKADNSKLDDYHTKEAFNTFTGDTTGKSFDTLANDAIDAQANSDDSSLSQKFATKTSLKATENGILGKFSASGGMNLIRNSIGFSDIVTKALADTGTKNWFTQGTGSRVTNIQTTTLDTLGFGSGFQYSLSTAGQNVTIDQYVNVVAGKSYTLSWYLNKVNNTPATDDGAFRVFVYEHGQSTQLPVTYKDANGNIVNSTEFKYAGNYATTGFESDYITFTPSTNKIHVRFYGHGQSNVTLTGIMLTIGDLPLQWSLAYGESFNTNVRMDLSGIRVSQLGADGITEVGYTQISPDEFAGWYDSDGDGNFEKVFYLNEDETVTKKLKALNEITLGTFKIININQGGNIGWAFVPTT